MDQADLDQQCHNPDCHKRAEWVWEREATAEEWALARAAAEERWRQLSDPEGVARDIFVPDSLRAIVRACDEHMPRNGDKADLDAMTVVHRGDCVPPCACDRLT